MESKKQRVCLEQTCHIECGFNGEAYRLSAGGENKDQVRSIAAGEVDATSHCSVGSVSSGISLVMHRVEIE